MSEFGWILGAKATTMPTIFEPLRRSSRANSPYPQDGEMASICGVDTLDRVSNPLIERLLASSRHFCRHFEPVYEFTS